MQDFVAVEWLDETHSVIPKSWIIERDDAYMSYYPPNDVVKKAKRSVSPDSAWPIHWVACIIATSRKYRSSLGLST